MSYLKYSLNDEFNYSYGNYILYQNRLGFVGIDKTDGPFGINNIALIYSIGGSRYLKLEEQLKCWYDPSSGIAKAFLLWKQNGINLSFEEFAEEMFDKKFVDILDEFWHKLKAPLLEKEKEHKD